MTKRFGWTGTILAVDLTNEKISTLATHDYSDRFLGGLGIGQKLYWDCAPAAMSAYDPANPLIFMTGPLAGTAAPAAPRMVVCGRSPCIHPETFTFASLAGFFPAEIKKAGYDGIIVTGRAARPVYISIQDTAVAIKDAAHLWGLTNSKARAHIQEETGKKARILSIGPGGESRTRIGIIFTDLAGSASMGFGSVMGSKNLKAIAVQGSSAMAAAEPDRVAAIRKRIRQMRGGEGYFNLYDPPISVPGTEVVRRVHCHGCPQGCWRSVHRNASGEEDIRKCQTPLFYAMWDKRHHGKITDASFYAPTMANDYGLCIMEIVFLLLWLDRCIAQGILTEKNTGLPLSRLGDLSFLETLLQKLCAREGFGEVLSQGALRASEHVGKQSRDITLNFLNQTGRAIAYGPKVFSTSAMIYATEPRPLITALHEILEPTVKWALWYTSQGTKTFVSTEVLRNIAKLFWGGEQAVDFSTYAGKARATQLIQNREFAKECMILCDFAWPVYDDASTQEHVGDPTLEAQLLSAVIGKQVSPEALDAVGERVFGLNRAILLREGRRGRQDDRLPEFFFVERDEPAPDGFGMHNPELYLPGSGDEIISRRGKAVDREHFEQLKNDYYELRGWDISTGYLKKETLERLDLKEAVAPLEDKAV